MTHERDFSKKSSTWTSNSAKKAFDRIRTVLAPVTAVGGLGDAAFWSPSDGAIVALSGDIVLQIIGDKKPASKSVEVRLLGLMRKALKRT